MCAMRSKGRRFYFTSNLFAVVVDVVVFVAAAAAAVGGLS